MQLTDDHVSLAEDLAALSNDPLRAIKYGFPWNEGELSDSPGPRKWQAEVLSEIGKHLQNPNTRHQPCQIVISSGHDVGKSALISMLTWWALSTFEHSRVNITANTGNQLTTKTSPEMAKWFRLAINADWFQKTVTSIKVQEYETWRADLVPWSEDNTAAFAGLHNKGRRILFVIDEGSEVPQPIFDVMEGAMLDEGTQTIVVVCGNPTMPMGPFVDIAFGRKRNRWKPHIVDSRDVEGTNKQKLEEWLKDYGEDSDFFKVRARGLPPTAGSAQFIDQDLIDQAQKRKVVVMPDEPLVAGVDFAWGGSDDNVVRFRQGADARSIPPIKVKGEFTRDPAVLTGKLADILTRNYGPNRLAMLFLDSAGIAAAVESRLRQLGHENIMSVNFGAHSPDNKYAFMRDYMWGRMKEWLRNGAIDDDRELATDLGGPCLVSDRQQRVKLEPKEIMQKRGLDSPDDADALALTFAVDIPAESVQSKRSAPPRQPRGGWQAV